MKDIRTWNQRLRRAMEARGVNQTMLAKMVGVSNPTVHAWMNDQTGLSAANKAKIDQALDLPAGYLIDGIGDIDQPVAADAVADGSFPYNPDFQPGRDSFTMLPVVSSVQAGAWGDVEDPFEPGDADSYAAVTGKWSDHAFVLAVEGDSMTSYRGGLSIPDGAQVIVEPEEEARNGSIVVAKLEGVEQATVKRLVIDPPHKYLMPLNDQYDKIEINSDCRIVGVVKQFFMVLR